MDEIKINSINYLEHLLHEKSLFSRHLVLNVEASKLCETIKNLSEGLTPEEIFLLIIENTDFLIRTGQYAYAKMIACIAVKFLEDNLCQPDDYLQYSLFRNMQYLFQDNPLVYYQYGLKLLNLLEDFKKNPVLKAGAIKQFNCFLINMIVAFVDHTDSFNEEDILALAKKVAENITALIAEKNENIKMDDGMIIKLIVNFSSQLLATDNTKIIISFIDNIKENHRNSFISMPLFFSIYPIIHEWLYKKTNIASNSLTNALSQLSLVTDHRPEDFTNLEKASKMLKTIHPVWRAFLFFGEAIIEQLKDPEESNDTSGASTKKISAKFVPLLNQLRQFEIFLMTDFSGHIKKMLEEKSENVEKNFVSITPLSFPNKASEKRANTGSKKNKKKTKGTKSRLQQPKPLSEKKSEKVVSKPERDNSKEKELYIEAFAGEPKLLAKYQDILRNTRLAYAGVSSDTGQEKKQAVEKRSRIKSLLDDASQKNNELIKEANAKNKPLIVTYAYITAIEIDQMACININVIPQIRKKLSIQSCQLNLKKKEQYLRVIELNFSKLQVFCDEYYVITEQEKAIIEELKALVPILVSHWEKMVIKQAKWNQYIANKAKFIEERIIEIDEQIKRLEEGKGNAINDGRYFNNPNPSYDCARTRFELEERRLQFTYLQRNISPAAHKDKADSSVNHQPPLQEQTTPQTHASSDNSVLTVSLEEGSFKSQEASNPPPPDETPVLHSSTSNLGAESQEDDLGTPPLNTPDIIVSENDCAKIVAQDHVPGDECAEIVAPNHVPGDPCAIISMGVAAQPTNRLSQADVTWLLSLNKNQENVPSVSRLEEKPIKEEHEKSRQEGSAVDRDNTLTHRVSTNENQRTEVSASNPSLPKKSLTFFPASKPAKYFYDQPKVLTNMLSSYFEQAIQFGLGLTLIEHKEHLIVIIYTNRVEDRLFLMDTPTHKDLQDIDLLTISKQHGNVPILIKVKDSNHYFIFGCLGNNPWKTTKLCRGKNDVLIKLLEQTEEDGLVNTNKLSQDVLTELKKYHSFFVHFPQAKYNFFFDEKHVLQILNTRKLQICPEKINIKRAGSLEAPLFELIHNIAANKEVPVPMISSNLSYPESVSPSIRLRS